jgi:hypothetical protein
LIGPEFLKNLLHSTSCTQEPDDSDSKPALCG